jgi:hypothetical protein
MRANRSIKKKGEPMAGMATNRRFFLGFYAVHECLANQLVLDLMTADKNGTTEISQLYPLNLCVITRTPQTYGVNFSDVQRWVPPQFEAGEHTLECKFGDVFEFHVVSREPEKLTDLLQCLFSVLNQIPIASVEQ